MDTVTATIIIIAFFALIVVASFLVFRQRSSIKIKGPSNTGLELDASNDPIPPRPGIDAENIKSRKGGVVADDRTGRGVKVKEIEVEDDVLLSSSPTEQGKIQEEKPSTDLLSESNPIINAQIVTAGRDAILAAAGRDIVIQTDQIRERVNELIDILNGRAERIIAQLANHYNYVEIKSYLAQFEILHKKHIEALEKGNIAHAHEILGQIHELSFELEKDEFWTRHHIETPFNRYSLSRKAFQRGPIICAYVAGDMKSHSPNYTNNEGILTFNKRNELLKDALTVYRKMLASSKSDYIEQNAS